MDSRLSTSSEEKEARRIARLRKYHKELRERFLCPNVRLTGRDEQALSEQIKAKNRRKQEEQLEDKNYAQKMAEMLSRVDELEQQRQAFEKKQGQAALEEWKRVAEVKRKELEAIRQSEKNALLNPKFRQIRNEEEEERKRMNIQKSQIKQWVAEQLKEKEERRLRDEAEAKEYDRYLDDMGKRCDAADKEYLQYELQRKLQIQSDNLALAKARADRKQAQLLEEKETERKEVDDAVNGVFLSESDRVATSATASHRVRTDHYKGMTKEETTQFLRDQSLPFKSQSEKLQAEKLEGDLWKKQQDNIIQFTDELNYNDQLARKQKAKECSDYQKMQMELKAKRLAEEREYNRRPVVEDSFFHGFGQSHR